ncbi:hypothetical protein [Corynebacterium sp. KPL2734]|uniref:hypothetical protein n=1 Tax=Corynebacterium sp. KPL2734 TaxID=3158312 RepID=UPI0032ECEADF
MKFFSTALASLIIAFCLTGSAAVLMILYLAFSNDAEEFKATGLFDSVFFSSSVNERNNLDATFGINSQLNLFIIFMALFIFSFITILIFRALTRYKENLKSSTRE